jgi:hypothetical protein
MNDEHNLLEQKRGTCHFPELNDMTKNWPYSHTSANLT